MTTKDKPKSKDEQDRQLSKELAMTFPASDPPATSQPGAGITGPEDGPRNRDASKKTK
jgi:hypothetical protein